MSQSTVLAGFGPVFGHRSGRGRGPGGSRRDWWEFFRPVGAEPNRTMISPETTLTDLQPTAGFPVFIAGFAEAWRQAMQEANADLEVLLHQAGELAAAGMVARQAGDELTAESRLAAAHGLAAEAVQRLDAMPLNTTIGPGVLRLAACHALNCGEAALARYWLGEAESDLDGSAADAPWTRLQDASLWPDAWLVAAVRREPPDEPALDALAERYWKRLYGRCELLTLNRPQAADLAQEAWCRVLRSRRALKPGGNFPAYIATIATNIWRDWNRSNRRAGPMGSDRLASLDAALPTASGDCVLLGDLVPDLDGLQRDQKARLMLDIDQVMGRLPAHLRDVLISRYLDGESCAEIGRRYKRTEQSISGWVREAVRQIKMDLEALPGEPAPGKTTP